MIKIGISGLGRRGLTHLVSISDKKDVQIFAFDPHFSEKEDKTFQDVHFCATFQGLLDKEISGIIITSPDKYHYEQAILAIKSHIPILLEKPSCYSICELNKIISFSEKYKTPVYVGYQRRLFSIYQKVKKILQDIPISDLLSIHCHIYSNIADNMEYASKLFFNTGCHYIDIINYLFPGNKKLLNSNLFFKDKKDTCGTATLLLKNKIPVFITFELNSAVFPEICESQLVICIKNRTIILSQYGLKDINLLTKQINEEYQNPAENNISNEFLSVVLGNKNEKMCKIQEDLETISILENIYNKGK